jgi:carbonic anhydrase/acetyltransferase-like protein (isoleucine patch superfamily)
VTERKSFPDRSLIMGAPAKVVRELTDDDVKMLRHTANTYLERRGLYLAHLQRLD